MSLWSEVPFENVYLEPSKNGINRSRSTRGSGYKMINMGELFAYGRINNPEMELVPLNDDEKQKYGVQEGDLLFARQSLVKEGAGKCSIVLSVPETTCFEGHLIRVRLDKSKVEPLFYYYYFLSYEGNGRVQSLVMQVAAAGIRGSELAKLNVPYPPIPAQRRIANILSAYDDLIENNTRRIRILEQMAQAIYQEWFGNVDKESLPKGWEIIELQNTDISIIDGDRGKNYPTKNEFSKDGYCLFLNAGNFKDDRFDYSDNNFITEEKDNLLRKGRLQPKDIVLTTRGTVGKIGYFSEKAPYKNLRINSGMVIIRPKANSLYWYFLLKSPLLKEQYKSFGSGSAQPQLPIKDMNQINVLVPPDNIISQFCEVVEPIAEQIEILLRKNTNLRLTRDLLLPRLVSGEIELQ